MIRYSLKCAEDHEFESWFQSASAFDKLVNAGMVSCPICGGDQVEKALMAPKVTTSRVKATVPAQTPAKENILTTPSTEVEAALAELKKKVEETSEYVGPNFATEARKIHDGDGENRSIYGEASREEAKSLVEDGVAVMPLPFMPKRKTN